MTEIRKLTFVGLLALLLLTGCAGMPFHTKSGPPPIEVWNSTLPDKNFDLAQVAELTRRLKNGEKIATKDDEYTLVLMAAMTNNQPMMDQLKKRKVNVDQKDSMMSQSALQQTVLYDTPNANIPDPQSVKAVIFLIKNGANPNLYSETNGSTALMSAVNLNNQQMVKTLLKHGADPNQPEKAFGLTALHSAASEGHLPIAQMLLDHGANVNARDRAGQTPLHQAASLGRTAVVELLLKHGADAKAKSKAGTAPIKAAKQANHPTEIELLRQYGAE